MEDNDKLDKIETMIQALTVDFRTYTQLEELRKEIINNSLEQLKTEVQNQGDHFNTTISNNREHFDRRITVCDSDIKKLLKEEYITRSDVNTMREHIVLEETKTRATDIATAKADITTNLRGYVSVVSGTVVVIFIILTYMLGIQ